MGRQTQFTKVPTGDPVIDRLQDRINEALRPLRQSPQALVTQKGSLVASTAAGAPAEHRVGSDARTLVSDSSQTTGLRWASGASIAADASGQDDTAGIQSTINNATSVVNLPAGTFNISGAGLSLPTGKSLIGAGKQKTILRYSGAGAGVTMDGTQACLTAGLEVQVTGGTGTEVGILITNAAGGAQRNSIRDCYLLQNNATPRIAGQNGILIVDVNGGGAAQYWNHVEGCDFLNWDTALHLQKNGGTNGANQNFLNSCFYSSSAKHLFVDGGCNDNSGHGHHGTHSSGSAFTDVVVTIGDGATVTNNNQFTGIISDMGANGSAFNITAAASNNVVVATNESSGADVDSGTNNWCLSSKNISGLNQRFRVPNLSITGALLGAGAVLFSGSVQHSKQRAAGAVGVTLTTSDRWVQHSGLAGAITDTLPTAAAQGLEIILKDKDGSASGVNTITVAAAAGQTVDNAATQVAINTAGGSKRYRADGGTNWESW